MKRTEPPGAISRIWHIGLLDSSSLTGEGLPGVVYNAAGLSAHFMRAGATAPTVINLVSIPTLGTYVSGGFRQVSAADMPGVYEFHPPNAMLAAGAAGVVAMLKGAANMAQLRLEIQLNLQFGDVSEAGETYAEGFRLVRAAAVGKANGFPGGPVNMLDAGGTKNRIVATVDTNGNRSAVTVDAS